MISQERKPKGKVAFIGEYAPDLNAKYVARTEKILAELPYVERVTRAVFAVLDFLGGKNPEGKKYPKRWLADKLGISEQAVGQMLKTGGNFTAETIHKLGQVIGVDLFAVMADMPEISKKTESTILQIGIHSDEFFDLSPKALSDGPRKIVALMENKQEVRLQLNQSQYGEYA